MEFENYLAANEVSHNTYKSERGLWDFLNSLRKKLQYQENDPMKVLYIQHVGIMGGSGRSLLR